MGKCMEICGKNGKVGKCWKIYVKVWKKHGEMYGKVGKNDWKNLGILDLFVDCLGNVWIFEETLQEFSGKYNDLLG